MLGLMKRERTDADAAAAHNGEPALETAPVVKVIEIIGTSATSFDDAIARALAQATKSLRGISGADVQHMTLGVRDGQIHQYRVALKVAFAIDEDEEDDD